MILFGGQEMKVLEGSINVTLTDTYTSRTTANGLANLKNGRFTTVKKIQGATVLSNNLVNIEPITLSGVSLEKILWEGDIQAPFTLSWNQNFSNITEPGASLFLLVVDGATVYISTSKENTRVVKKINRSGRLTKI